MYISTVAGAAVAVLVPLAVRADVKLTNNLYKDINAGEPFTLTWSGDESVSCMFSLVIFPLRQVSTSQQDRLGTFISFFLPKPRHLTSLPLKSHCNLEHIPLFPHHHSPLHRVLKY